MCKTCHFNRFALFVLSDSFVILTSSLFEIFGTLSSCFAIHFLCRPLEHLVVVSSKPLRLSDCAPCYVSFVALQRSCDYLSTHELRSTFTALHETEPTLPVSTLSNTAMSRPQRENRLLPKRFRQDPDGDTAAPCSATSEEEPVADASSESQESSPVD